MGWILLTLIITIAYTGMRWAEAIGLERGYLLPVPHQRGVATA